MLHEATKEAPGGNDAGDAAMYDLGDVRPGTELNPGTNLLISGPPMAGKDDVAFEILATGSRADEGVIIVSTKDSARETLSQYEQIVGDTDDLPIGIVDCVTQQQGADTEETTRVKFASSPVDMTGIGIRLSELLEEFYTQRGIQNNRVLLHSISTLLMYSDLKTVFRFLHVFTGRVTSADALGLYTIDPTTHDEQAMNTLKQLFDGVLRVETVDGERTISTTGL